MVPKLVLVYSQPLKQMNYTDDYLIIKTSVKLPNEAG